MSYNDFNNGMIRRGFNQTPDDVRNRVVNGFSGIPKKGKVEATKAHNNMNAFTNNASIDPKRQMEVMRNMQRGKKFK